MERFYFKYDYGFVNVDDDGVYFSSTGNWQTVKQNFKYNDETVNTNESSKTYSLIFLLLLLALLVISIARDKVNSIAFIVTIIAFVYSLYRYFKPNYSEGLFIKREDIIDLIQGAQYSVIKYRRGTKQEEVKLYGADLVGIEKLYSYING